MSPFEMLVHLKEDSNHVYYENHCADILTEHYSPTLVSFPVLFFYFVILILQRDEELLVLSRLVE